MIISQQILSFLYFASAPRRHLYQHPDWLQRNHLNDQLFNTEAIKATSREMMKIISVSRTTLWLFSNCWRENSFLQTNSFWMPSSKFWKNFTESWKFFKGLENLVLNRKCMWWLTFEIKIRINNYFPPCRALCILRCRFNEHHFVKERFKNSFFDDAGQPPFARINLLNYPSLPKFIKTKCITEIEFKFGCFSETINCFGTIWYIFTFDKVFFQLKWS